MGWAAKWFYVFSFTLVKPHERQLKSQILSPGWPGREHWVPECKLWWLRCKYLWFVTWATCKHKHSHQCQCVARVGPHTLGTGGETRDEKLANIDITQFSFVSTFFGFHYHESWVMIWPFCLLSHPRKPKTRFKTRSKERQKSKRTMMACCTSTKY